MKLHFQEFGAGEPLILLHGLLGCLDNWVPLAKRFAAGWRVFAVDLRNHGHSPHDDDVGYAAMADDVAALMREQKLDRAHVLGHSLGGKTAMQLALARSDLVASLVVVDMSPRAYAQAHEPIFDAMLSLNLNDFGRRHEIDEALATRVPSVVIRRFILKNVGRDEARGFYWKPNLPGLRTGYSELIRALDATKSFDGPTMFVRGGRSDHIREDDWSLIRRMFPGAKLVTIERAGHWVHAEAADEFAAEVEGFLGGQR